MIAPVCDAPPHPDRPFTAITVNPLRYTTGLWGYTRRDANEAVLSRARNGYPEGAAWPCPRAPESLPCNKLDPLDMGSNNVLAKVLFRFDHDHWIKLTGEYFDRTTRVDQLWDHGRAVAANGSLSATTFTEDYKRTQELQRYRLALEHSWQTNLSFLDSFRWQFEF